MKTATARGLTYSLLEASAPLALYRSLLAGMVVTQQDGIASAHTASGRVKLLKASSNALSALAPQTHQRFGEWVRELAAEDFQNIALGASASKYSREEFFNSLANSLFDEEVAKAKGAIFTPTWLAERLVSCASKHWTRLNVGKQPSLAADLSCGPGIFLTQLASKFPKKTRIIGVDNCPEYVSLARLLTSQCNTLEVHCVDTLLTLRSFGQLIMEAALSPVPSKGYDIIVGNPPYVRCQSLDSEYSKILRELYPSFTAGNFDLASLFLAHTLEALAPGGIAALVISSKFMNSRYGAEICRRIGQQARLLEIVDFGDGQVFDGRTTYTCTLTFAKLPPNGRCKVLRFPPGLKWSDTDSHMSKAEIAELPSERFQAAPWDLSSGVHDDVLRLMRRPECPRLMEVFPTINQGIRTGANQFFVVPKSIAAELEQELVLPYISGENIRCCRILPPEYSLIWPYRFNEVGAVVAIREDELSHSFPRTASYLGGFRESLSSRDLEPGSAWYCYSRSQNLDLAHRPKLIGRELMPRAEFAADEDGKFAICSGYALLPPSRMPMSELRMWAAVLCTPTMEFQLRYTCTQLHSGWFRILKHHLSTVRVPPFSQADQSLAISIADRLHKTSHDQELLSQLDAIVARAFGLTDAQRLQIQSHIGKHHTISTPKGLFENTGQGDVDDGVSQSNVLTGSCAFTLSREDKERYLPVELPEYYQLHTERENLGQAVTFVNNKSRPIHRWYGFTQGFSAGLVEELLAELGASSKSRIYDPFAGSGTTLLTCKQRGIPSFGAEISPLMCWITRLKTDTWDPSELARAVRSLEKGAPSRRKTLPTVFQRFFEQAYSPVILEQIFGWRDWMSERCKPPIRDFLLLGLASILETVSQLRKHGSHYRFLNKTESVGLAKLNIPVISSDAEIRPILVAQLNKMISDLESTRFVDPTMQSEIFNLDSRLSFPAGKAADCVITSPPYLNRNMYFAQQKAELVLLEFIHTYDDYRLLVRQTFRSHVEGELSPIAKSTIPEVQAIVDRIQLTENNNAKIPHMVCGYFEDLQDSLSTLRPSLSPGARLAFVVGNCRWGGVVVPVDHLLAMIAERLGYRAERIIVTRLKGNSPQQMRRYGKIPMRESIVLLSWKENR
jgi:methylase of polypeptide subunit release factors